jgi:cytochrome b561/polyisoprenoid-binding protein YceI
MLRNTHSNWGAVSKTLHWLTLILILAAVTMGWVAELWPVSLAKINLFVSHKSIGISILVLVIIRLGWKVSNPVPGSASGISEANNRLAHVGHWALYGILLAMPLSGWILNSAANFPFKWLGLVAVPNLVEPNEVLQGQAEGLHFVLFLVLTAMVVGHAAAAIWHHVSHKSDLLVRMLPSDKASGSGRPRQLFATLSTLLVLAAAAILWTLSQSGSAELPQLGQTSENSLPVASGETSEPEPTAAGAENTWIIDHSRSALGFTGLYAGVEFDGDFTEFSATMIFNPEHPESGLFDVSINTTTINTNSADRDSMMPEQDWFHFESFPNARYLTSGFAPATAGGYIANGNLTIKGIDQAVDLPFQWTIDDDGTAHMTAETAINRIDFGLGARDWADDDTIGFNVVIKVDLWLSR